MTPLQLEALTLRTVDQVRAGQPVEDAQIELKRVLPADPYKAARRIGGHANASRGQPVVWIIGLDEDEGVTGADKAELSDWWPQVQRYFDDLPPELLLQPMNVPVEGDDGERLTVVALAFDTSRLPFVVTAKGQAGPIQREVPYRDATGLRSAKRGDIIRLALPARPRLEAQVLWGDAQVRIPDRPGHDAYGGWFLSLTAYLTMRGEGQLVFPAHTVRGTLEGRDGGPSWWFEPTFASDESNRHVSKSGSDLIVTGPGRLTVKGRIEDWRKHEDFGERLRLTAEMQAVHSEAPLTLRLNLREKKRPATRDEAMQMDGARVWGCVPWAADPAP